MKRDQKVEFANQGHLIASDRVGDDVRKAEARSRELVALLKPKKTIQLAASGPVMITELERAIIDTAAFQRLRGVRQLGAAYLVYPTAVHTRFDHSLGTLQMLNEMIRLIRSNQHSEQADQRDITPEQEIVARLYALLHDVPHVPLGHTIEDELQILERHDENESRIDRFLGANSEIGKLIVGRLGEELHGRLLDIYRWDDKHPEKRPLNEDWVFIHDLVSNTVCADLLDYIRRDDFFCNLGVGMPYHFLNYLYLDREKRSAQELPGLGNRRVFVRISKGEGVPRRDILSDLCRLLEARYMIAERVYFHHAKIVAGAMLGRAIQEYVSADLAGSRERAEDWLCGISDQELLSNLRTSASPLARRLSEGISSRRLYKTVRSFTEADAGAAQASNVNFSIHAALGSSLINDAEQRRRYENELADVILADPGDVLIYAPPTDMNLKIARMRVLWNGEHSTLSEIDDPIVRTRLAAVKEAHKKLWSIRLIASKGLSSEQLSRLQRYFIARTFETDPVKSKAGTDRVLNDTIESFMIEHDIPQPTSPRVRRERVDGVIAEMSSAFHGSGGTFRERLTSAITKHFGQHAGRE